VAPPSENTATVDYSHCTNRFEHHTVVLQWDGGPVFFAPPCILCNVCSYCLFGSISTLMKEDMAEVLEPMVTLMITSVKSTEGITVCTAFCLGFFSYQQCCFSHTSSVDCVILVIDFVLFLFAAVFVIVIVKNRNTSYRWQHFCLYRNYSVIIIIYCCLMCIYHINKQHLLTYLLTYLLIYLFTFQCYALHVSWLICAHL